MLPTAGVAIRQDLHGSHAGGGAEQRPWLGSSGHQALRAAGNAAHQSGAALWIELLRGHEGVLRRGWARPTVQVRQFNMYVKSMYKRDALARSRAANRFHPCVHTVCTRGVHGKAAAHWTCTGRRPALP